MKHGETKGEQRKEDGEYRELRGLFRVVEQVVVGSLGLRGLSMESRPSGECWGCGCSVVTPRSAHSFHLVPILWINEMKGW